MPALVHASDAEPGLRRKRVGRGFSYLHADGRRVDDEATLARIHALAIPPAYTEVWICADPRGHLQATGRDARGRKQYRYHRQWQEQRGGHKYDRVVAFAEALPKLRRRVRNDLRLPGFPRRKVVALVVALLGHTLLRVGNEGYTKDNGSYGLTTLRNTHARFVQANQVRLAFRGKGGKALEAVVDDARLVRLVRRCRQLPGQPLFQYRQDGRIHRIGSGDVNRYLRQVMGGPYSAKDFRTWGATVFAFRVLAPLDPPASAADKTHQVQQVLQQASQLLGNTPRICEKCYIDPCIFEGWATGQLGRAAHRAQGPRQWERAAIGYLKRWHRRQAADRPASPARPAARTPRPANR